MTTKEGGVRLWATREARSELMMAFLRVVMGVIFLAVWSDNLIKGYYSSDGWADFVQRYADTTKVGLYADVLNNVMIPNSAVFAYGQFVIEFVVFGLFLVLGVFTPVSALLAALFQLNLLIATSGTTDWPGTYIIMAALLLAVSLSQAGRTLGVDALLARRNPLPRLPIY
jgi:thiosulfate dehydrogenase (quinone) large subunit